MINRDVRITYQGRDQSQAAARSAAAGAERVQRQLSSLGSTAVALQRTFAAVTLGFAGSNAVRTLGDLQESLLRVQNLSTDYAKSQQFLAQQTRALNLDLQSAAQSFAEIQGLQSTGLINDQQARDLFVGFSETAAKFGVSSTDIQFALKGLRQALTAGVVRAQEFDQVTDAIGAVLPGVARNLGVTTQELLKMRTSASLSSDAFLKALIPALNEAQGSAAKASDNINASLRRLSTAYKEALLEFERPIGDSVGNFADAGVAAINLIVENAGKLQVVGAAIAAAYGGRAVAAIAAVSIAQARSLQVSVAQTQAIARNNALRSQEATIAANLLGLERTSILLSIEKLRLRIAETTNATTRLVLTNALIAAEQREVIVKNAAAAASANATRANLALAASQRAATTSSIALTGATTALNGALALFGGPVGAAALALGAVTFLSLKQSELQKNTIAVIDATRDLNREYARSGDKALTAAAAKRQDLQIEVDKLIEQRDRLRDGSFRQPIFGSVDEEAGIRNLTRRIDFVREKLDQLEIQEGLIADAKATSDEFEALGNTIENVASIADRSGDLIAKFLPNRSKIAELEQALSDARSAFAPNSADGNQVISAIQAEINALDGSKKAREEYNRTISNARKELDALNESLLTERQRVQDTFSSAQATISLNVELGTIDESTASTALARARERLSIELAELDTRDLDAANSAIEEKKRLRDADLADFQQYQDRLIQARSVIDPAAVEVEQFRETILRLKDERDKGIASDQDYYLFVQSAAIQHNEALAAINEDQLSTQRELFSSLSGTERFAAIGDVASTFLDAFQKNVGEYIQLNDSMTDAEQKNAIASNAINKRRFEDNKKASIAQSVISTITAATRALETVPYPLNFAAAAAVAAAGFRNVSNIRSASFGSASGGSVSSGASLSSATSDSASSNAVSTETPPIAITFVIDDGLINQRALETMSVNAVATATQNRELTYDTSRGFYTTNNEAA